MSNVHHQSSKLRLDQELVERGLLPTRSQAESYIKLGSVTVNGKQITKPGFSVSSEDKIKLTVQEQYVSRAGLKLASVAQALKLDFTDKVVLDVGSSTGGFTDYALRHGAKKVIAVDVGTEQLHSTLRTNPKIELHEQTDIRNVRLQQTVESSKQQAASKTAFKPAALTTSYILLTTVPNLVLIDVSFISLRDVLPHIANLSGSGTLIVAMVKPQFEAGKAYKHKGVIKNDKMRRNTLQDFENWVQRLFIIISKADSEIAGAKGNRERFYLLVKSK